MAEPAGPRSDAANLEEPLVEELVEFNGWVDGWGDRTDRDSA
jgi:hypothetical protein